MQNTLRKVDPARNLLCSFSFVLTVSVLSTAMHCLGRTLGRSPRQRSPSPRAAARCFAGDAAVRTARRADSAVTKILLCNYSD